MKIIIFHPQGNANVKAVANAMAEAGMLSRFFTSIACFKGSMMDKMAGLSFLKEIRKRRFDPVLKPFTRTFPLIESGRLISSRLGLKRFLKQETGVFSVHAVTRHLDKNVAYWLRKWGDNEVDAVYAYEDEAYYTFRQARVKDIKCFYDLPTGYWRSKLKILENEKINLPEWNSTNTGSFDSETKLNRKDEEIKMADCIIVASKFTANTLKEYPGKLPPVEIIPYGFPEVYNERVYREYKAGEPVKLLFIGNLSQQKGIAYLFSAVNELGSKVSLTLVGRKAVDDNAAMNSELVKHNWIPSLHHDDILKVMREHDVLVFPTLFDGFGLVVTEAMSQGTPVIASMNSCGPDLIQHGKNGWLVEAGSVIEIRQILEQLIHRPQLISEAGKAAMVTAGKRSWQVYKEECIKAIKMYS